MGKYKNDWRHHGHQQKRRPVNAEVRERKLLACPCVAQLQASRRYHKPCYSGIAVAVVETMTTGESNANVSETNSTNEIKEMAPMKVYLSFRDADVERIHVVNRQYVEKDAVSMTSVHGSHGSLIMTDRNKRLR